MSQRQEMSQRVEASHQQEMSHSSEASPSLQSPVFLVLQELEDLELAMHLLGHYCLGLIRMQVGTLLRVMCPMRVEEEPKIRLRARHQLLEN